MGKGQIYATLMVVRLCDRKAMRHLKADPVLKFYTTFHSSLDLCELLIMFPHPSCTYSVSNR